MQIIIDSVSTLKHLSRIASGDKFMIIIGEDDGDADHDRQCPNSILPQQDCLWRHLHEALELLAALEQVGKAGTLLQADLVEEADPDDLPEQPQDQVWCPLGQVIGVDVDNVAADALGGREGQGQVLVPVNVSVSPEF